MMKKVIKSEKYVLEPLWKIEILFKSVIHRKVNNTKWKISYSSVILIIKKENNDENEK